MVPCSRAPKLVTGQGQGAGRAEGGLAGVGHGDPLLQVRGSAVSDLSPSLVLKAEVLTCASKVVPIF